MALAQAAVCAAKACGRHFKSERFEQLAYEFTFVTVSHSKCCHFDRMHRQGTSKNPLFPALIG